MEKLYNNIALNDDFYQYYEDTYELVGNATNKRYKLGQKVKVIVDSYTGNMKFYIIDESDPAEYL